MGMIKECMQNNNNNSKGSKITGSIWQGEVFSQDVYCRRDPNGYTDNHRQNENSC
jgi:hypothetical protein